MRQIKWFLSKFDGVGLDRMLSYLFVRIERKVYKKYICNLKNP